MRAVTILPPAPPENADVWHVPDTMPPSAEPDTDPCMVSLDRMLAAAHEVEISWQQF